MNNIKRFGLLLTFVVALTLQLLAATPAVAAGPEYRLQAIVPEGIQDQKPVEIVAWVTNVGDVPLSGTLTVTHTFPVGIAPIDPEVRSWGLASSCQIVGQQSICDVDVDGVVPGGEVRFVYNNARVSGASGTLLDTIAATGGGMPDGQTVEEEMTVGAFPPFALKRFGMELSALDRSPATQAGSTPREAANTLLLRIAATDYLGVGFQAGFAPAEHLRDAVGHVPAGFIGTPTAVGKCTIAQLAAPSGINNQSIPACPQESQVGYTRIAAGLAPDEVPLYSLAPPPGSPAAFGFHYQGLTIILVAKVRPDDYGIDLVSSKAISSLPLSAVWLTLWGVPADPSHDTLRQDCMAGYRGNFQNESCKAGIQPTSFLRMPTSCSPAPLPWSIDLDSYEHPDIKVHGETTTLPVTGCGLVPFDPAFKLTPSTLAAHAPTGVDATLTLPQDSTPDGLAEADLRRAEVTLPQGMALNPASAEGLAGCSDAQLRLGQEGPSQCPDASKLGTLELRSPLLDHPLPGSVFLRSQGSGTPESGDLYRLALEVRSDDDGIAIKLPGSLKVDPNTGRLTTVFDDLPQLPFEATSLHLKAGPRAPLLLPQTCGTYNAHAELTSWSGKTVSVDSRFKVDKDCTAPPFAPVFHAGVRSSTAGSFSPFTLRVTRDAGQPNLSRIDATLPEGELAKLAGVPVCSDTQAAAASCPAASKIGSVVAGIGDGPSPLYLPQPGKAPTALYLAGPYKGAPYSLLAAVPAQAGPFDLGTVAVRSALRVDPVTTRASVLSDPLPQIYGGIPVSYRDVRVNVDRPGFTLNPTDCEPKTVDGTLGAATGASATVSDHFQASDCAALGFKPKLALSLFGKTRRGGHPTLRAVLKMPAKGANIARAAVTLPRTEFLENAHIRTVCTRVQFAAGAGGGSQCPAGSVYGHARAISPLLDYPLEGPVYLRSSSHELPDLVAALDGQIHVDLDGRIDSVNERIRNTFELVPDAPVSKFVLTMQGGGKGLLVNNTNICRAKPHATALFDGQNGKTADLQPLVKAQCGAKAKRKLPKR